MKYERVNFGSYWDDLKSGKFCGMSFCGKYNRYTPNVTEDLKHNWKIALRDWYYLFGLFSIVGTIVVFSIA